MRSPPSHAAGIGAKSLLPMTRGLFQHFPTIWASAICGRSWMAAAKGFDGIERKAKLGGNPLIAQTLALEGNDFLMVDSGHDMAPFRGEKPPRNTTTVRAQT